MAKSRGFLLSKCMKNYAEMTIIRGHNLELLASLIPRKHGYVEDVKDYFDFCKVRNKMDVLILK